MKFRFNIYAWGVGNDAQLALGDKRLVGSSNHLCQSLLPLILMSAANRVCIITSYYIQRSLCFYFAEYMQRMDSNS